MTPPTLRAIARETTAGQWLIAAAVVACVLAWLSMF